MLNDLLDLFPIQFHRNTLLLLIDQHFLNTAPPKEHGAEKK